jgi:hypothetical protein
MEFPAACRPSVWSSIGKLGGFFLAASERRPTLPVQPEHVLLAFDGLGVPELGGDWMSRT